MAKSRLLLFFLLLTVTFPVWSQSYRKHVIRFSNKEGTPYSVFEPEEFLSERAIDRRDKYNIPITEDDLPVNPAYCDSIRSTGASLLYTSKWFNAAVVLADEEQLNQINNFSFVRSSDRVTRVKISTEPQEESIVDENNAAYRSAETNPLYGLSYNQIAMMNGQHMHSEGYKGEGMLIAVLDAGFNRADEQPYFRHLFNEGKILGTYDFVDNEEEVYEDHPHGTHVLSLMGAYQEGEIIGTAYQAEFLLLRTEDASSELQIEEVNWLLGAEYADSAGADILQTSLGYTTFDDPSMDYSYEDMDGETSLIVRASTFAASKGMLLVASAGNEGSRSWRHIVTPADGKEVLAVGAVNDQGRYASFSSIGPTADGRIKPDVTAQGNRVYIGQVNGSVSTGSGTSYSAPLVAGLAAGLWQSCREKSAVEIREIIKASASQYEHPDNRYGYGIPNYLKAREMMKGEEEIVEGIAFGPNPVADEPFFIHVPTEKVRPFDVRLIDNTGKIVDSFSGTASPPTSKFRVDTANLLPGMYLVQVHIENQSTLFKLLKVVR
ncbi:S8 family serine peptidase [Cytophagaceae bacterium ABcell3]|nr:S8 family serine peptidase [Cytophagaceae bacterium ABcell3]